MPQFPTVDEQLAYLRKGAAEIIRESDLRERIERSIATGMGSANPGRMAEGDRPYSGSWETPSSSS